MSLSLVVLAAGVGSRYGGPKQIDRVGPGGATLLDYAAFDARRAGFERVILVVREGMEAEVREAVGDRIARRMPVAYAVQGDALPAGFVPPPGRSQAVGHRPRHPRRRAARWTGRSPSSTPTTSTAPAATGCWPSTCGGRRSAPSPSSRSSASLSPRR